MSGLPCNPENHTVAPWPAEELEKRQIFIRNATKRPKSEVKSQEQDYFKLPQPPKYPPKRPHGGTRMLCIAVCMPFTTDRGSWVRIAFRDVVDRSTC